MIQLHIYSFFFRFFSHLVITDIEDSSLCYTVDPCWLPFYIVVCKCQSQTLNLSTLLSRFGNCTHCFLCLWICFCFVNNFICIIFQKFHALVISYDISPPLSYFTQYGTLWVHCCKWQYFIFLQWFPGWLSGKQSTCDTGDAGLIHGLGRSLEKEMATHFNLLAWEIPWTERPVRLQSIGSQKSQT